MDTGTLIVEILDAARGQNISTWLDHAEEVYNRYGIKRNWDTLREQQAQDDGATQKKRLKQWKMEEILPKVDAYAKEWYMGQILRVPKQLGPYPDDTPQRNRPAVALQWAPWTPATWHQASRQEVARF